MTSSSFRRVPCAVRLAALLSMLAAAGCASVPMGPASVSAAQVADPALGVVLLSTTAQQRCTQMGMWAPLVDGRTLTLLRDAPIVPIDATSTSDFPDAYGTLVALALPAGRYAISPRYANPGFETNVSPSYAFDVVAGHTTYLGEIHRLGECHHVAGFVVRDGHDRDIALAKRLNPLLATRPIETHLVEWHSTTALP